MAKKKCSINQQSPRFQFVAGIFILVIVNVLWVGSSEATRFLFNKVHYEKPFFTAYFKSSMFTIYLLGFLKKSWRNQGSSYALVTDPALQNELEVPETNSLNNDDSDSKYNNAPPLTPRQNAFLAFIICFPWFIGASSYQLALAFSNPALVNTVSSMSTIFTLILSAIFPVSVRDRFNFSKLLSSLLCVAGVFCVSYSTWTSDDNEPNNNNNSSNHTTPANYHSAFGGDSIYVGNHPAAWGILSATISALCYASYLIAVKKAVDGHEERLNLLMFFGFVGLFVFLLTWPLLVVLQLVHLEEFALPSDLLTWSLLVLNGIFGTILAEWLWLWGCFLTSSLLATIALSMNTPLSILADMMILAVAFDWRFLLGAVLVLLSFAIIAWLNFTEDSALSLTDDNTATSSNNASNDPIWRFFLLWRTRWSKSKCKKQEEEDPLLRT